jgi:hypothetical protein
MDHVMGPLFTCTQIQAQVFTHQKTVIEYLERMAQKGFVEFNDLVKPLDRGEVFQLLNQLQSNQKLTSIEKEELQFFLSYYRFDNLNQNYVPKTITVFKDFKKTIFNEPHLINYSDPYFRFMLDPVAEFTFQSAEESS